MQRNEEGKREPLLGPSTPNVTITPPRVTGFKHFASGVTEIIIDPECSLNELTIYDGSQSSEAPRSSFLDQLFLAPIYSEKLKVKSKST